MLENVDYTEIEDIIGYSFKNRDLLREAVTHSSFANEMKINNYKDYERLEFLGDAVLEVVTSEYIFKNNPDMPEGKMTKLRANIVCEGSLAGCAREFGFDRFILLGKGEEATGGRTRDSIISDVCEAIIGAVYLDGGHEEAGRLIYRIILNDIENKITFFDSKSRLQELLQSRGSIELHYEPVDESGPDHDKTFVVNAVLEGRIIGTGTGKSKKSAEQMAAQQAINKLTDKDK